MNEEKGTLKISIESLNNQVAEAKDKVLVVEEQLKKEQRNSESLRRRLSLVESNGQIMPANTNCHCK